MTRILVVRLGALGDIVHALPALAACRRTWPEARIDWLVEARHRHVLAHVRGIDRVIAVDTAGGWPAVAGVMRAVCGARYDVAIDFQGLIKSALLARWSGAARVAGFRRAALREPLAALAYSETYPVDDRGHVIRKNLALAAALGADASRIEFPLEVREPKARSPVRRAEPGRRLAEQTLAVGAVRGARRGSPSGTGCDPACCGGRPSGRWPTRSPRRRMARRMPRRRPGSATCWWSHGAHGCSCRATPGRCTSPPRSARPSWASTGRRTRQGTARSTRPTSACRGSRRACAIMNGAAAAGVLACIDEITLAEVQDAVTRRLA